VEPSPSADEASGTDPVASDASGLGTTTTGDGQPSVCGDGTLDPGELCDDGDQEDSDGCNHDCIVSGSLLWIEVLDEVLDSGKNATLTEVRANAVAQVDAGGFVVVGYAAGVSSVAWIQAFDDDRATRFVVLEPGEAGANAQANAVAVDRSGNIHVAGNANGSAWLGTYESGGARRWTTQVAAPSNATDVAVTQGGEIVVAGSVGPAEDPRAWVAGYTQDNTASWTVVDGGASPSRATGITIDATRGLFLSAILGTDETEIGLLTVSAGTLQLLARRDGGTGRDEAQDIEMLPRGSLVVGGWEQSRTLRDAWLGVYSTDGAELWTRTYDDGPAEGYEEIEAIAVTPDGDIVAAGFELSGSSNIWVARYTPTGELRWTMPHSFPAHGEDKARGITVRPDGIIIVVGHVETEAGTTAAWIGGFAP
jgi:cysteine-rich repeat protein